MKILYLPQVLLGKPSMQFLLDTHALVWSMTVRAKLPAKILENIADVRNDVWVSAISIYEIEYKRPRDPELQRLPRDLHGAARLQGLAWLPIDAEDALRAAQLDNRHRDPCDRIIAAQADRRRLDLITSDRKLTAACVDWAIPTLW